MYLYYIFFREKGISLRVILKEVKEELLCGDSFRLNQILNNLLSNAYKFTDDGGSVTITITQKEVAENNCDVIFEVADTGCGIAKEFLESVFEPFEQQDAVIARRYGGSGLGLAITKQLIELMNERNINAYYIPTSDFHESAYVGEYFKARSYMSGFDGSAGVMLVTPDASFLWTDGRYFLQAEAQLKDSEVQLMKQVRHL